MLRSGPLRPDPPAGLTIAEVAGLDGLAAIGGLFDALWRRATPAVPLELLRALTHAGNYAAAAHDGGRLVGGLVAFAGWHDGEPALHSHILGVVPDAQGRGVGAALKQHQRAWSRARGLSTITWTFDPLVRRNARFNLTRLGAHAVEYLPDFYGLMDDGFNADAPTDRLLVAWPTDPAEAPGAPVGRDELRCATPEDVVALRRTDPAAARAWSERMRATLGAALDEGYTVTGLDDDGAYVLTR